MSWNIALSYAYNVKIAIVNVVRIRTQAQYHDRLLKFNFLQ